MKLILQAIKALFRKIEASIDNAQTAADNAKSLADNAQTTADSKMSVTNPVGSGTFSMGRKSGSTVGAYSHAEGFVATASGAYSHAEGYTTTAEGAYSHAEGSYTTADGACSHAEGKSAKAHGDYSHAEGRITTASGESSHAEGCNTVANGMYSHSEGYYTKAGGRSQHVYGEYNINDGGPSPGRGKYVQIVGNGTSTSLRSNAHTLDWSGNAWFSGDVYVGSTSGTDKDDGSKKLATEEYVNNKVSDFGGIQSPTNAEVGQTIVVKSVDENGKPTEWEAVDVPGGGSCGGIHRISRVVTEANAALIEVTGLSTTSEVLSLRIYNQGSSCGLGLDITVNGVKKVGFTGTNEGTGDDRSNVRAWLYRDGGTLYGRSVMTNGGINDYNWPEIGEITGITVGSTYNNGTTKYFQTGTIFEIYEGMYPNVQ